MKKAFSIIAISFFCIGCNMNPNKETRIQKLETEIQQSMKKITRLEKRLESLEAINAQLKSRIQAIERQ